MLEKEMTRLKEIRQWSKELRRSAGLPVGVLSKPCTCCGAWAKRRH